MISEIEIVGPVVAGAGWMIGVFGATGTTYVDGFIETFTLRESELSPGMRTKNFTHSGLI